MSKFTQEVYAAAFGDAVKLSPTDPKVKETNRSFIDTWKNNGWNEVVSERFEISDLIATPNATHWLPQVIEEIVREPVEPLTIIPSILDRVNYTSGLRITLPAIGAIVADDIAEGQPYPETQLQIAPGSQTITVGKSGVAFKISEEMIKHSMFDIVNLHLMAGRKALDRHKEVKGFNYITGMGVELFNNRTPTTSVHGVCTGRAIDGSGNGSMRMEDLIKAYAHVMFQGFIPNALILHPLTWAMWMADPVLRIIAMNTGNMGAWFNNPNVARQSLPWQNSSQARRGRSGGFGQYTPGGNAASATATALTAMDPTLSSRPSIPGYFPFPLQTIVTPFAPYNVANNTCDIIICDLNSLGALVVEEDVSVDEWDDKSVDMTKYKLREKYSFAVYDEGLGIGVMKNIPVKANEIALPMQATISGAGSLSEISASTAIAGL
jgi:hypothetical protein